MSNIVESMTDETVDEISTRNIASNNLAFEQNGVERVTTVVSFILNSKTSGCTGIHHRRK